MRFVNWRITPDDRSDASPITFQMECVKCSVVLGSNDSRTSSPTSESFADVQDWALRHSGRNPEHTAYREHVRRTWRTQMEE